MRGSELPEEAEKRAVWDAYFAGRTTRVPVRWNTNPRVVILDPSWNPEGTTFEEAAADPRVHVEIALRHELYRRRVLGRWSDLPRELPEVWEINLWTYNVYEAASLGAELIFLDGQVPDTRPLPGGFDLCELCEIDVDHPLELPFIRDGLVFWKEMERVCEGLRFEGRPVKLVPWDIGFSDGPLTVACNLRGEAILADLVGEPEAATELLAFITRAAIQRRRAFQEYWGDRLPAGNGLADDSIALISPGTYREMVLPHHRDYYEAGPDGIVRTMHLCGDATRHFRTIHEELGVDIFDTGYPVDHGWLRGELGEQVELYGGPEVALLLNGTPEEVHQRARSILESGVKRGGRFVLQEGNNLPPRVPEANLEAAYRACLEHGWID